MSIYDAEKRHLDHAIPIVKKELDALLNKYAILCARVVQVVNHIATEAKEHGAENNHKELYNE